MKKSVGSKFKASALAVRLPQLLACTLLSCAIAAQDAEQADDEPLNLSRLVFEVATIPLDQAPAEAPDTTGSTDAATALEGAGDAPASSVNATPGSSPAPSRNLAADIDAYRARIADTQANENPYSAALREQFDALGMLLQEAGNHEDAIAAFESAMHIDRVNDGLYTLEQIPVVEKIIASHEVLGNEDEVNDLHAYLFYIQQKSYAEDDPRLLAAKEQWADWNLESYLKEAPEDGFLLFGPGAPSTLDRMSEYVAVQTRSGSVVYVPRSQMLGMTNMFGSSALLDPNTLSTYGMDAERVVDERLRTARDYYEDIVEAKEAGANLPVANSGVADAYRIEHKLAGVAYAMKSQLSSVDVMTEEGSVYHNRALNSRRSSPLAVTRGYAQNRDTLESIATELEQNPDATAVEKAQAWIDLGDWHIGYDYSGRAEEAYRKAWELLKGAGMDAAAIDAVFMPQPVVPAPAFVVHPYSRAMYGYGPDTELPFRGHMDLTLTVNRYGDVSGIKIDAATPGTLQVVRSELLDYLRGQKMRPAIVDGEAVKREDVKLRYYYSY